MKLSMVAGWASAVILLSVSTTSDVVQAAAQDANLHASTKLVSISLPTTLNECGPSAANSGGRTYKNLWTVKLVVIDAATEKVFTNATGYTITNPQLSIAADHSFHNVIAKPLSSVSRYVWGQVTKFLKLRSVATTGRRGLTLPAGLKRVPRGDTIVLYSSTSFDVSQGFVSNVSRGCNLVGSFTPWATSAMPMTKPTYSSIVVSSSSLVNGKFVTAGAMSLVELKSVVTESEGSNTGPLPTGFGFPKVQGELFRNNSLVSFTRGGSGTVFVGWSKDELPQSNTLDPFTLDVSRSGSW